MDTYVCAICGYIYDEAAGIPQAGIAPGTRFADLPGDWVCPVCGASKEEFVKQEQGGSAAGKQSLSASGMSAPQSSETGISADIPAGIQSDIGGMTSLEMSALCTNLARGAEKQYNPEASARFLALADSFKAATSPAPTATYDQLLALVSQDLDEGFPAANAVSSAEKDRGALRALVWSEKVTRMHKSLLARYQKEGDAMLDNTGVYVCSICGFVFLGDAPPALCPVCKVPDWKFVKVEGR